MKTSLLANVLYLSMNSANVSEKDQFICCTNEYFDEKEPIEVVKILDDNALIKNLNSKKFKEINLKELKKDIKFKRIPN